MTPPFRIDIVRRQNPLWGEIKDYYERRLVSLRAQNDDQSLDAIATAALRARIAECKLLISLEEDLPIQEE